MKKQTDTTRDPRLEPAVGDVVSKGKLRRTVVRVASRGDSIKYENNAGKTRICWITTWRDWCREAEVEKKGC